MLAPLLSTRTDPHRHLVRVAVAGPLTTADHGRALRAACAAAPPAYGVVVTLSSVTLLSEAGIDALRCIARDGTARGTPLVFVCSELMLRSELVLADLDTLAPIVHADEQAVPLASDAA